MIHLNKTLCVNVLFIQNLAQLQKQIEDCNPNKGKCFENFLKKIVKNRGLGLGLQNLKDLFGLQVTK